MSKICSNVVAYERILLMVMKGNTGCLVISYMIGLVLLLLFNEHFSHLRQRAGQCGSLFLWS